MWHINCCLKSIDHLDFNGKLVVFFKTHYIDDLVISIDQILKQRSFLCSADFLRNHAQGHLKKL